MLQLRVAKKFYQLQGNCRSRDEQITLVEPIYVMANSRVCSAIFVHAGSVQITVKGHNSSGIGFHQSVHMAANVAGMILIAASFHETWAVMPNTALSLPAGAYYSAHTSGTITLTGLDTGVWRVLLPSEVVCGASQLFIGANTSSANAAMVQMFSAMLCLVIVLLHFGRLPGPIMALVGSVLLCWAAVERLRPAVSTNGVVF